MTGFTLQVKTALLKLHFVPEIKIFMGIDTDRHDSAPTEIAARLVACPHCKGDSMYHPSNPSRPFCSPKCRAMDLGAWANEDFRVAESRDQDDSDVNGA